MDLIDIYRAFHLKAAEYSFFLSASGTFSRIDHMLGLRKFKKIEITSNFLFEHIATGYKSTTHTHTHKDANNTNMKSIQYAT